jgi:predicted ATPase/DNA-binding SARP family transcriptional activator
VTQHERPAPTVRVDVLGPLRLTVDGAEVDVPGPRRRAVLAMLAMAAGHTVSVDALLDAVWPEEPPDSGRRALHSHISRLRGHLGAAAGSLVRDGTAYRLDRSVLVDAEEVRASARSAREQAADDPGAAAAVLADALAKWRGDALAEFAEVHPLAADAIGLANLRSDLVDEWLEARLVGPADPDLVADASRAARAAPQRERTAIARMRALAREGRSAEALRAAHELRRSLGEQTGLDPSPAFAAAEREIAADPPAPAPPPAPSTPLRARPATPFVGRHRELALVRRELDAARVLTVVGPGGVGKTRLALEVAADERDSGRAVYVVEMATVEDERHTWNALATALGLRAPDDAALRDVAVSVLASAPTLLLVDNCEHVLASCRELVAHLVDAAPQLTVLATSREPLDLPTEHLLRLGPLPVPDAHAPVDDIRHTPAVEAFIAHAGRRAQGFVVDEANAALVADIVRGLDGLPLALELAAGRVDSLGIDEVHQRLGRALDLLGRGRSSSDDRHRTLRSTIEWSYRLLQDEERALLRLLAVFPAGTDLRGIELIAARQGLRGDPAAMVAHLVDASVAVADTTGSRTRFRMLETVRAFALGEAEVAGDRDALDDELARSVLALVLELDLLNRGPREVEANERLLADFPNIRAARDVLVKRDDREGLVTLTLHLHELGYYRSYPEVLAWAVELGEATFDGSQVEAPLVLGSAARAAWLRGELDRAERYGRRAIELATDERQLEAAYDALGIVALFRGDFALAGRLQLQAADVSEDPPRLTYVANAGLAATYAGDDERARTLLGRARELCDGSEMPSDHAFLLYCEAELLARHDLDAAIERYERAIAGAREVGASFGEGIARVGLVAAQARRGQLTEALDGYRWLVDHWRRAGSWTQLWTTLRNLAQTLADADDPECAAFVLSATEHAEGASVVDDATLAAQAELRRALEERLGPAEMARIQARAIALPRQTVVEEALEAVEAALRGR